MKTIHKQTFETTDTVALTLSKDSEILTIQTQNNIPCVWYQFDLDNRRDLEARVLLIFGTGHEIDDENRDMEYLGTYQLNEGTFIFHVFELIKIRN